MFMSAMQATILRTSVASLLFLSTASATGVNIWAFDPWYAPAPPPAEGPPLSRHASRNPQLLKWQILGIVGGYVFFVLAIFSTLLTVGKRWRRAARQSRSTLAMEMVKPGRWAPEMVATGQPDPKRGILSRTKSTTSSMKKSPIVATAATFDPTVIEADKAKREEEMAKLYEAVMQGDTRAPKELSSMRSQDFGPGGEAVSLHSRSLSAATSTWSFSQKVPPQLRPDGQPMSPTSPYSRRNPPFTTPPQQFPASPTSPTSPRAHGPGHDWPTAVPTVPENRRAPVAPHSRHASASSSKSRTHRSARNLTISAPMHSAGYAEEDDSRTPLSPRAYNPGRPPMPPGPHYEPPETPATPILDDEETDDSDVIDAYGMEGMTAPRPIPLKAPQRPTISVPLRGASAPDSHSNPQSATGSVRTLPLRAYPSHGSMSAGASRPDISNPLASPPPTKVTLLSPRNDRFPGQGSAPLHPLTAGLPTPYSPYMPRTPMTPITPHLASRSERRQRHREEGRRVATAEDAVIDENTMWGTGL